MHARSPGIRVSRTKSVTIWRIKDGCSYTVTPFSRSLLLVAPSFTASSVQMCYFLLKYRWRPSTSVRSFGAEVVRGPQLATTRRDIESNCHFRYTQSTGGHRSQLDFMHDIFSFIFPKQFSYFTSCVKQRGHALIISKLK